MQADIVAIDASENILLVNIFLKPCLIIYPIELILIYVLTLLFITNDYALLNCNYTLSHRIDNFSVMSNYNNCCSASVNCLKKLHDFPCVSRVKVTCRLVCKQNRRIINQSSCNCNSLLFST